MNNKMVLLVEDSQKLQSFNKRLLQQQSFEVETAMTLSAARDIVTRRKPDIIVLDIGMPDGNGLDFLREFRQTSKAPVLLLTGYSKPDDIVQGFNSGCNDYLPKPYTPAVLMARLKNLLQSAQQIPDTVTKGALTLKITSMSALLHGVDLLLSQKEFSLLNFFIQHESRCVTVEYIYEQIWGYAMAGDTNAVKFQISRLRIKLENSGYNIVFERGRGYRFEQEL